MRRGAAVAGSWYPGSDAALRAAVDQHVRAADATRSESLPADAELIALIAPHAGLIYSGPVAAHGYSLLRTRAFDCIVLVGPSHYVPFDGVSIWPRGEWETPCGPLRVDDEIAAALQEASRKIRELNTAHQREHSLEMQLPFLATLAPDTPIVPMVMGHQTRATACALGEAMAGALNGRRALLIASSDLSHFYDARVAAGLDTKVVQHIDALDPEGLMTLLEQRPDHACGGGPVVSVMIAARALGASASRVLRYADSGDVSGDKSSVVGYLSAALWKYPPQPAHV